MLRKRIAALALAAVMACTSAAPALAAGSSAPAAQVLAEDNALVAIRIEATDKAVYGQPFEVSIRATPEDTQYSPWCWASAARPRALSPCCCPRRCAFCWTDPPAGFYVGGPGQHPGL